jgi:multidrug resistance efflux pump
MEQRKNRTMKMKTKTKYTILFFAIWIPAIAFWFFYEIKRKDKIIANLAIEYPLIEITEQITGQVTSIYYLDDNDFRINTNSLEITINDTLKRRLNVDNEIYTGKRLHDVLTIGDSLHKQADSTTIAVFKIRGADTLKYRFPLLNEKLHPLKK